MSLTRAPLVSASLVLAVLALGCGGTLEGGDGAAAGDGSVAPDAYGGDAGARDAGPGRDGAVDAGTSDAGLLSDAGPPAPTGPVLYPSGARHSPIEASTAATLRAAAARGPTLDDEAFMKVGDSITVSSAFLHCFDGSNVDLDGRPLAATVSRFGGWWARTSEAATVGWSANAPLSGSPSALSREQSASNARFATVMFGTNDVGFRNPEVFARDLWTIADQLLLAGAIPLMSSIPPRDDSAAANANVPIYNLAVRALAQGRAIPFVDFHAELSPLPNHGLAGDGVHPQVYGSGGCRLTAAGLPFGYNVRNLITLEQLDRAGRALDGEVLDTSAPRLAGAGTAADPHVIEALPFAVMGDTRAATERGIDRYGCSDTNESGPSLVYRLELASPARLHAAALSASGADLDVHLLAGAVTADACVARDNREVTHDAAAGTWYVVADTYTTGAGVEQAGEVLVLVWID